MLPTSPASKKPRNLPSPIANPTTSSGATTAKKPWPSKPTPGLPPCHAARNLFDYAGKLIPIAKSRCEPVFALWNGNILEIRPDDTVKSFKYRRYDENMEEIVKYQMTDEYEEKEMEELKRTIAKQRKLNQIVLRLPRLASAHDNEKQALKEHIQWCIEYGPISDAQKVDAHLCYVREVLERHGFVKNEFEGVSSDRLKSDHVRYGRCLLGHVIGCAYHFPPLPVHHAIVSWMENWIETCPW